MEKLREEDYYQQGLDYYNNIDNQNLPEINRIIEAFVSGLKASKEPKHETEDHKELKEENTDLNISIRKVTDERDMAIEALENIRDCMSGYSHDGYKIAIKALSKLKDNQEKEK